MLRIYVTNEKQRQWVDHVEGLLEMGRGPQRGMARFRIEDVFVSRDQLRLEESTDGQVRVENLSLKSPVLLTDGNCLAAGQPREFSLPLVLRVGKTRIKVEVPTAAEAPPRAQTLAPAPASNRHTISVSATGEIHPFADPLRLPPALREQQPLAQLSAVPTAEKMAQWLESIVALQHAAAATPEFYQQTARVMVELIGLDLGLVLLGGAEGWQLAGSFPPESGDSATFSHTLLQQVLADKQTLYQDANSLPFGAPSLTDIEAVVVSPIFSAEREILGVLYGARNRGALERGGIQALEAQLVQLLAATVAANLARALATRTRVQFEHFFSPQLVAELERDSSILEGRTEEVTLLCSGLRGCTGPWQRLDAQGACRLLRDLMEQFSERIVEQGGVIVDYAADRLQAMWNAPFEQPDHVLRACQAALAMLDELPALNARWRELVGEPLTLGIGVHTGMASVGSTGSSRKFRYAPHGCTVALANRVQEATEKLGLSFLITGATRDQLSATLPIRRLGQVRLPGLQELVMLHEVRGETSFPEWLARRDVYEKALELYENENWSRACLTLLPLLHRAEEEGVFDTPTLRLMRRASACLEAPPEVFDPVIEIGEK